MYQCNELSDLGFGVDPDPMDHTHLLRLTTAGNHLLLSRLSIFKTN